MLDTEKKLSSLQPLLLFLFHQPKENKACQRKTGSLRQRNGGLKHNLAHDLKEKEYNLDYLALRHYFISYS